MGRKKLEIKRMNTNVTIRQDLKEEAKRFNINLSQLLEKAIIQKLSEIEKKDS
ncbi:MULTISPECIES: type II toxin-antitoxin system CcdA family antitoxin [Enterococcus]|uniref:Type II toxin-antitoxin system CcdA family antitoxin n=1 Tax=Candidatus Enterococcus murrayae TaxID=2815321 RepID=A0ABS3HK97_9ENTE|nr:type II toxin-antitoxin system CcdA family antitoxin [Enterococcus sp. MJM16]MBO0453882.1 type II toxin-antitoxin system CcdA family antitoxin [Enterococcus sp. MJM16]